MIRSSLFRRLFYPFAETIRRPSRRTRRSPAPLRVEALEDRTLLTLTYAPPSAIDLNGAGDTSNNGAVLPSTNTLSADGRYAVFVSSATDLTLDNYSGPLSGYNEVYLRDLVPRP